MKWRVWFAKNDADMPWRIQHVDDLGKDEATVKASSVEFQQGKTEVDPSRKGRQPAEGVVVCEGKVYLNGTKAIIS